MRFTALIFLKKIRVGRATNNDLILSFSMVSCYHLEIKNNIDEWYIKDLVSANRTIINGKKITQSLYLILPTIIQFGGSELYLELSLVEDSNFNSLNKSFLSRKKDLQAEARKSDSRDLSVSFVKTDYLNKQKLSKEAIRKCLLSNAKLNDASDYTNMVRAIIQKDRSKRRKYYKYFIFFSIFFIITFIGLLIYQQLAIKKIRYLAIDMFYEIKTMELALALALAKAELSLDSTSENLKLNLNKLENKAAKEEESKLAFILKKIQSEREK